MAATYILGPFCLDAETDTLFRGGEPVSLGHRAVALLRVLETSDLVERLKALDVSFDNANFGEYKKNLTFKTVKAIDFEIGSSRKWLLSLS